jgi:hypothetical protein
LDGRPPCAEDYLFLLLPIAGDIDTIGAANSALAYKEIHRGTTKDNFDIAFTFGHDADAN